MDGNDLLSRGIQAARDGDRKRARELIGRAVQIDPELAHGWWALAHLLEDGKQQIYCLQQVLRIDPEHEKARAKLAALTEKQKQPARPEKPAQRTESEQSSPARQPSRLDSTPSRSEDQSEDAVKGSTRSSAFWIGVIAALGLFLVGVALTFLIIAGVLRNPFSGSQTDLSSVVLPTMPPAWTPTPTRTPPAQTETVQADPVSTPAPVAQLQFSDEVEAALELLHDDRLDAALRAWDEILADDPDDHFSLAMRAHTRLRSVRSATNLGAYIDTSLAALADADRAIELSPNVDGDYYVARSFAFENLSKVAENRVDQDRLVELALENMLIGIDLPHTDPTEYYSPPLYLLRLGRCDEALQQGLDLIAARGEGAAPVPTLHEIAASGYFCLGEYDQAIEHIDIAIDVIPLCNFIFKRALILYHAGSVGEALAEIDRTIEACPSFSGTRYYLRALIMYEQGNLDQASQDLFLGSLNTWAQGGLKAYVEGLIAQASGDRALAIDRMKYAEQTMDRSHGPFIEQIRSDLAALGASPDIITPQPSPAATPIPALPESHPTPPPETYVIYTNGSGSMRLEPGATHYFHFVAPQGFKKESVSSLKAHLIGGTEGFPTDLELLTHNPAMAYWRPMDLVWGTNEIWPAADYVNTSGDINIRIRNNGAEPIEFEDFGITINVVDPQGAVVQYSYLDEQ